MTTSQGKIVSDSCEMLEGNLDRPRKCVVIHRRRMADDLEKIELRYVAYNRVDKGEQTTAFDVMADAAKYMKEQANEVNYKEVGYNSCTSQATNQVTFPESKQQKKLRLCLPVLNNIRARFEAAENNEKVDHHTRRTNATLRALCDEILEEATYTLQNGTPITADLMKKIQNINDLTRKVLAQENETIDSERDDKELAVSQSSPYHQQK
ncbi:unnamed protein product [Caenorhabditis angaria]|uniref:Uncharacterized protein n=1 Tax=Caenorhabditis angaria TaxID=860376 RepID=A0A9P1IU51_9PELO|nr:unnamed protein product [Caenorhabditis angaria]